MRKVKWNVSFWLALGAVALWLARGERSPARRRSIGQGSGILTETCWTIPKTATTER